MATTWTLNKSHITNNQSAPDVVPQLTRSETTPQKWCLHRLLYARVGTGKSEQRLPTGLPSPSCRAVPFAPEQGPLWHQAVSTRPHCCSEWWIYIGEKNQHLLLLMGSGSYPPSHPPHSWKSLSLPACRDIAAAPASSSAVLPAPVLPTSLPAPLPPLISETLGPFKKLYRWIFVATWRSLCKGFRAGGD